MKDEDYLDENFPKEVYYRGIKKPKSQLRGEAMVLLALSRQTEKERIVKEINDLQKQTVRDSASYQILNQLKKNISK